MKSEMLVTYEFNVLCTTFVDVMPEKKINYALSFADVEAQTEWIELEEAVMKTVYEMFPFALPRGFRLQDNQQRYHQT